MEVAYRCGKGTEGHVIRVELQLVVTLNEVQGGDVLGTFELVKNIINSGQGESIFDCQGIQGSIVIHSSEGAILLLNKQYRCAPRGGAGLNELLLEELLYL